MLIDMWRTTKRDNSTATPGSQPCMFSQHIQKEVCLKEPTDILNPVFQLKMSGHDGQNYAWAFGRYYWITGIKSLANNLFEISCAIDPLGSYRGRIRNTQAYVLYDSTPNTEIPDKRLGVDTTATYSSTQASMPWNFVSSVGTKFVAIEGDGDLIDKGKADSATGVYVMTDAEIQKIGMPFTIQEIIDNITSFTNVAVPFASTLQTYFQVSTINDMIDKAGACLGTGVTGIVDALLYMGLLFWYLPIMATLAIIDTIKGLILGGDALKHVKSAYWLPFDFSSEGTSKSRIAVGSYVDNNLTGRLITNPKKSDVVSIAIPWQYSDWRNSQNTEIQLYIPLIGNISVPSSAVKGHSTIDLYFGLNMYSGAFAVRVRCGTTTLGSYGVSCLSPILIGDSNPNASSILNTIGAGATAVAGAATGNVALTAGAITGTISTGLDCIQPISTSVGGIGGGISNQLGSNIFCTTICHNTSDNPSDLLPIIGTPTNVLKQLNGTGFCQCYQPHLNMNAVVGESYPTKSEMDMVNSALASGVFLE